MRNITITQPSETISFVLRLYPSVDAESVKLALAMLSGGLTVTIHDGDSPTILTGTTDKATYESLFKTKLSFTSYQHHASRDDCKAYANWVELKPAVVPKALLDMVATVEVTPLVLV